MTLSQAEVNQLNICSAVCYHHRPEREHTQDCSRSRDLEVFHGLYSICSLFSGKAEVLLWLWAPCEGTEAGWMCTLTVTCMTWTKHLLCHIYYVPVIPHRTLRRRLLDRCARMSGNFMDAACVPESVCWSRRIKSRSLCICVSHWAHSYLHPFISWTWLSHVLVCR